MEEYRFLDGWSQDKRGIFVDRIPTDIIQNYI